MNQTYERKWASAILKTAAVTMLLTVGVSASAADAPSAYYHAALTRGTAPETVISNGISWFGNGSTLFGGELGERPWMVCAELAQSVGPISSFSADGVALPQDKLDYCNKKALKNHKG